MAHEQTHQKDLTVKGAAEQLGYTPRRVLQLIQDGKLLGHRVPGSRKWLISADAIAEFKGDSGAEVPAADSDKLSHTDPGETTTHAGLDVVATCSADGKEVLTHGHDTMTLPFIVEFSIYNRGDELLEYYQFHVWRDRVFLGWYPEQPDFGPWKDQGDDRLPPEFGIWSSMSSFVRDSLQNRPSDGFLMPSDTAFKLHPLTLWSRYSRGMIPLAWKLEAPGWEPVSGAMLIWSDKGRFDIEYVKTPIDFEAISHNFLKFREGGSNR